MFNSSLIPFEIHIYTSRHLLYEKIVVFVSEISREGEATLKRKLKICDSD